MPNSKEREAVCVSPLGRKKEEDKKQPKLERSSSVI